MSTISVAEAKAGFAKLVDEAANGDFVTITRHGKAAAVLVSRSKRQRLQRRLWKSQSRILGISCSPFPVVSIWIETRQK